MSPLQGIEPGQRHRPQFSVGHDTRGNIGRVHRVPGGARINQDPDVDADYDGDAADVKIDQIEPLKKQE